MAQGDGLQGVLNAVEQALGQATDLKTINGICLNLSLMPLRTSVHFYNECFLVLLSPIYRNTSMYKEL